MSENSYSNEFQYVKLEEECPQLTYKFLINRFGEFNLIDTLIIAFHGKYRDGAAGRPDAGFMKGIIQTGIEVWDPFSVLVDLRELDYEWGDNIDSVFAAVSRQKVSVLVGDKNRRGLSTLEYGTKTNKDIVDNEFFFDDFEKAINNIRTGK